MKECDKRNKETETKCFFCGNISGYQNPCLTVELIQYYLSTDYICVHNISFHAINQSTRNSLSHHHE